MAQGLCLGYYSEIDCAVKLVGHTARELHLKEEVPKMNFRWRDGFVGKVFGRQE